MSDFVRDDIFPWEKGRQHSTLDESDEERKKTKSIHEIHVPSLWLSVNLITNETKAKRASESGKTSRVQN